jgi:hypothetical protein
MRVMGTMTIYSSVIYLLAMSEDKKVKRSGTAVSAFLPNHYVQKMDELIAEGKYNSRSDFVRDAIRDKIDLLNSRVIEYRRACVPKKERE